VPSLGFDPVTDVQVLCPMTRGVVGSFAERLCNRIDSTEHEVTIQFEGRAVIYDYADLNELGLAWSISIHKSQGSEYPVVILPLYMQHFLLLSRNLVYRTHLRSFYAASRLSISRIKHSLSLRAVFGGRASAVAEAKAIYDPRSA